jgi:hypothetical protein
MKVLFDIPVGQMGPSWNLGLLFHAGRVPGVGGELDTDVGGYARS